MTGRPLFPNLLQRGLTLAELHDVAISVEITAPRHLAANVSTSRLLRHPTSDHALANVTTLVGCEDGHHFEQQRAREIARLGDHTVPINNERHTDLLESMHHVETVAGVTTEPIKTGTENDVPFLELNLRHRRTLQKFHSTRHAGITQPDIHIIDVVGMRETENALGLRNTERGVVFLVVRADTYVSVNSHDALLNVPLGYFIAPASLS